MLNIERFLNSFFVTLQAEQLTLICGAQVKIDVQSDTGKTFHYNSQSIGPSRHVKTQFGPSFIKKPANS